MHLHFFGRAREQTHQVRGQHMFLFPKDHPIYKGHLQPFNDSEIDALRLRIGRILCEPKYARMAALADIRD